MQDERSSQRDHTDDTGTGRAYRCVACLIYTGTMPLYPVPVSTLNRDPSLSEKLVRTVPSWPNPLSEPLNASSTHFEPAVDSQKHPANASVHTEDDHRRPNVYVGNMLSFTKRRMSFTTRGTERAVKLESTTK